MRYHSWAERQSSTRYCHSERGIPAKKAPGVGPISNCTVHRFVVVDRACAGGGYREIMKLRDNAVEEAYTFYYGRRDHGGTPEKQSSRKQAREGPWRRRGADLGIIAP